MWRSILIKILFRLVDRNETYRGINDKLIEDWLARQHKDMGFHEYFRRRDLQLLKTIGMGVGRTEYQLWIGQRLELLGLLQKTKNADEKQAKKTEELKKQLKAKRQQEAQ